LILRTTTLLMLVLAPAGCRRAPAHQPPPARVESCKDDLSGTWRAEENEQFRYQVTDEGQQVVLEPLGKVGGGYGKFRIVLVRTADGKLAGWAHTTYTENGKTCPVKFQEEIDSCRGGKLELAGETQSDIKMETCQVSSTGVLTVSHLVREKP
jgi:hypothetical protein